MSNPPRRRGGRGSDFGRRDQNWGSSRSGSPGSPGINGSPRTGRRDQKDRRGETHLPQTDHDSYVDYLKKRWASVQNQPVDMVTYYKDTEFNPGVPGPPAFDVDRYFGERAQQQQRQSQQVPPSHPQLRNLSGSPS